jgi:hypothetical protein
VNGGHRAARFQEWFGSEPPFGSTDHLKTRNTEMNVNGPEIHLLTQDRSREHFRLNDLIVGNAAAEAISDQRKILVLLNARITEMCRGG